MWTLSCICPQLFVGLVYQILSTQLDVWASWNALIRPSRFYSLLTGLSDHTMFYYLCFVCFFFVCLFWLKGGIGMLNDLLQQ